MSNLRVRVKVTEDNTKRVVDDVRWAVEEGLSQAVPGIIDLADRYIRSYSRRVADSLFPYQEGPALWLIRAEHHASHIVENGSRSLPAHPFLVPALLRSRGEVAKRIHEAMRDA